VEALVQDRGAVHAGAHLHHHIRDQYDHHLGAGYGKAAEPDISKDSDPKGTFSRHLWFYKWFFFIILYSDSIGCACMNDELTLADYLHGFVTLTAEFSNNSA
jgi:hypothetical protein